MHVKGAHHYSLAVTDVARADGFYGELLGLPQIERPDFGLPGTWYQAGAVQLHLIETPQGVEVGRQPPALTPLAQHIAFEMASKWLIAAGTPPSKLFDELNATGYGIYDRTHNRNRPIRRHELAMWDDPQHAGGIGALRNMYARPWSAPTIHGAQSPKGALPPRSAYKEGGRSKWPAPSRRTESFG